MVVRKVVAVAAIVLMTVLSSSAASVDNTVKEGARKVEGGFKAAGRSAEDIGTKAAKAASGAARDTRSAVEKAWDNIVNGLKKAFK